MTTYAKQYPERLAVSKVNMKAIKVKAASTGQKIYEVGDELLTKALKPKARK